MTNMTLTVPSCGVSAVTVSASNEAGTSDRSDPSVFSKLCNERRVLGNNDTWGSTIVPLYLCMHET